MGKPEKRFQGKEEYIILRLSNDVHMGFVCGHTVQPKNEENSIDWNVVSRIKLMFIGDEK